MTPAHAERSWAPHPPAPKQLFWPPEPVLSDCVLSPFTFTEPSAAGTMGLLTDEETEAQREEVMDPSRPAVRVSVAVSVPLHPAPSAGVGDLSFDDQGGPAWRLPAVRAGARRLLFGATADR